MVRKKQNQSRRLSNDELDRQVDESIRESFPASDPPAIGNPETLPPEGRRVDRKPPKMPPIDGSGDDE